MGNTASPRLHDPLITQWHRPEWMLEALCRDMDPNLFYPDKSKTSSFDQLAIRLTCAGCPVAEECLEYAIVTHQREGWWGGHSPRERDRIRRVWERAGRVERSAHNSWEVRREPSWG